METLLNLIWLIVALAGVWLWRFRWAATRENSNRWALTECAAMLCVLALLFPVISLSDDLHPDVLAVDAAFGKRGGAHLLARTSRPHAPEQISKLHLGVAVLSTRTANVIWPTFDHFASFPFALATARSSVVSGRSPPSVL